MSEPRDAALRYNERGWRVLPLHTPVEDCCTCGDDCGSAGKHPRVLWPDAQYIDRAQVDRWWRRWPEANVGVVTGAASGLLVLDVDPAHDGAKSLSHLERRYGGLPVTLTARSGGGGLHIYFVHPGVRIGPSAGKLGAGLDIRCDRGLIVAPPSRHASGTRYEWIGVTSTPAAPPEWLVTALLPPPSRPLRPLIVESGNLQHYAEAALRRAADAVQTAPDGSKHDVLWRQAFGLGTLVGAGLLDEGIVEQVLLAALAGRARSERAALRTIQRNVPRGRRCPRQVAS